MPAILEKNLLKDGRPASMRPVLHKSQKIYGRKRLKRIKPVIS